MFKRILRKLPAVCLVVAMLAALLPVNQVRATTVNIVDSYDGSLQVWPYPSYSGAQSASTGTVIDNATSVGVGQDLIGSNYLITRGALFFNTSAIPAGAVISSATLQLYNQGYNINSNFNLTVMNGQPTYPHNPLVGTDYQLSLYSGNGGTFNTASWGTGYNTLTLNSTGISWINKGGTTALFIASSQDISATAPTGYNALSFYGYAQGVGYQPVLNLTYTIPAAPTVTINAATGVSATAATLNGTINDDGGYPGAVQVKWGYGTTSCNGTFSNYTTIGSFSGTYSTGSTPSLSLTGLSGGSTYYFSFEAQNSAGITQSGELSFTTYAVPVIAAVGASSIAATTAQLNGSITNYGGSTCQVKWGYGTSSQTVGNFNSYTTVTPLAGSYVNGSVFLLVTGLTSNTTYYYRFQVTNATGTTTSTPESSFTTLGSVNPPTNIVGTPTASSIQLTWSLGVGATGATIVVGNGAYPTTIGTTNVYQVAGTSWTDLGLTPGKTYYFSLWGYSGATNSASYATFLMTTSAGSTTSANTGAKDATPWRFFNPPNYTNLQNIPIIYSTVNGVADTLNMPRMTLWLTIALATAGVGGIWLYVKAQSRALGMVGGLAVLTFWYGVQIVPWYIIGLDLMFTILVILATRELS